MNSPTIVLHLGVTGQWLVRRREDNTVVFKGGPFLSAIANDGLVWVLFPPLEDFFGIFLFLLLLLLLTFTLLRTLPPRILLCCLSLRVGFLGFLFLHFALLFDGSFRGLRF